MKIHIASLIFFFFYTLHSQSTLNGVVKDHEGNPIFAANVYLKSRPKIWSHDRF